MSNSLKKQAVSGIAWTSVERFAQQIIQFVIGVAIARVLSPADYGVVGMTAIFFAIANTFIDSGFGSALIQKKNRNEDDYSTCFYFNIIVSVILFGIIYVCSPAIARFYRTPILCDVTRVLSITLIINALSISQTSKLTVEMQFKPMAVITVVSQLATGALGLFMAYTGYGVWALVFQQICGSIVRLVLIEVYLKWIPKWIFSKESFHHMFSFGSKILCSSLIILFMTIFTH